MLAAIWKVRELLGTLVRRDLIVRYQSSLLGFLWSFAKPLALVAIFHFAFKRILKIDSASQDVPFALHLLIGILVWGFFSRCISEGHYAVLAHASLIKKIKLPVEVFPTTTVVGNLINFLLGMVVVFPIVLLMLAGEDGIVWSRVGFQFFAFIGLTLLLSLLCLAATLFVSAINVFYRDMESISEVGLQAWFYATPIVYPATLITENFASGVPRWLETLYWLNPMTPICIAFRRVLLYTPPNTEVDDAFLLGSLSVSIAVSLGLLLVSQLVFAHYARLFADEV